MEKISLTAQVREKAGKGVARELRRNSQIPAVLYGHGASLPIALGSKEVTRILKTEGGRHALINLTLEGAKEKKERMAMIKDYQADPIRGGLLHLDLQEVAMDEKVRVPVALHITGTSIGVKEGGILQHSLREVEVECLPGQIPDSIMVDISQVKVNESLHVSDIQAPAGVKILTDAEAAIVTIQPPISDAKLEAMLSAAPAVEAGEGEPELVKKPKAEAGAEGKEAPKGKEAAKEAAPKGKEPAKEAASKK